MATFVSGELGDMLSQTLEYRGKPLPQLLSYTDGINTSEYAANIGLALRQTRTDVSPTRLNLNITPEIYLPKPFPLIQLVSWAFILIAATVLLLFGISTMQKYRETANLETQISKIQTQVQIRQGTDAAIKQLQAKIDAAKKAGVAFEQPLDNAKAQREKVNSNLSRVTSLLPGIVGVNSISYNGKTLSVTGTAPDDTIIVNYVRDLRNSGQFSEVLITDMQELEYNKWQFTLTLK
jgi:Tfp pilus assembly protein PilN